MGLMHSQKYMSRSSCRVPRGKVVVVVTQVRSSFKVPVGQALRNHRNTPIARHHHNFLGSIFTTIANCTSTGSVFRTLDVSVMSHRPGRCSRSTVYRGGSVVASEWPFNNY